MAILTRIDNPILWQEFTHQERSGPRWMRWGRVLGLLMIASAIVYVTSTLSKVDHPTRDTALFVIWVIHVAVVIRTIVAGANAISREHVGQTWDALVLTGVSARQILFGKWRAALWRVRGWALALGVIRLAMLPIFLLSMLNRFAYSRFSTANGTYYAGTYYSPNEFFTWMPGAAILAVVMTVALTILEVLCCTALGLAASAIFRRGSTATTAAAIIRFAPVALFAAFARYQLGDDTRRWWRFSPFSLADGGTSPLYQLALPLTPWSQTRHLDALPGLIMITILLVGLMLISLAITLVAIRHTGALPHPKPAVAENS